MIHLFIDTNVFLNFFHYSSEDLDKLGALDKYVDQTGKISLYLSSHLLDEFYRNRETKIQDALKTFDQLKISPQLPQLTQGYEETPKLLKASSAFNTLKELLIGKIRADIKSRSLKADTVIEKFFSRPVPDISKETIRLARERVDLGRPPGKNGSYGDAIHWEFLLATVPDGEDLHIVSADGDYASPVDKASLSNYLSEEWQQKKHSAIKFYRSLNDFFDEQFPDIRLMDQYITDAVIDDLAESPSFDSSRSCLRRLARIGQFTDTQINNIVLASISNDQVYNAHTYSPEKVGSVLQGIVKGQETRISVDLYWDFCRKFGITPLYTEEDLPF